MFVVIYIFGWLRNLDRCQSGVHCHCVSNRRFSRLDKAKLVLEIYSSQAGLRENVRLKEIMN